MMSDFRADLKRYRDLGVSTRELLLNPAVWVIGWYRYGRWAYKKSPEFVRSLFTAIHLAVSVFLETFLQMRLDVGAQIGPGLLIAHCGGITLHPQVVIGAHCDLAHHVTIGTPGLGRTGVPVLGDNVYVGTGAVLIGNIRIGDGARIGANSLVNRDVRAGAVALGVPAREMSSDRFTSEPLDVRVEVRV
jgi:serine O-acetyltransferase